MTYQRFSVYDILDEDGNVVYVGCTKDVTVRYSNLRACAPWWNPSFRIRMFAELYSEADALMVEKARIKRLQPVHNVQHSQRVPDAPVRNTGERLIGCSEAAAILGWSITKVKRETGARRLPIEGKLPGQTGAYLFDRATVERIAANRARAEAVA